MWETIDMAGTTNIAGNAPMREYSGYVALGSGTLCIKPGAVESDRRGLEKAIGDIAVDASGKVARGRVAHIKDSNGTLRIISCRGLRSDSLMCVPDADVMASVGTSLSRVPASKVRPGMCLVTPIPDVSYLGHGEMPGIDALNSALSALVPYSHGRFSKKPALSPEVAMLLGAFIMTGTATRARFETSFAFSGDEAKTRSMFLDKACDDLGISFDETTEKRGVMAYVSHDAMTYVMMNSLVLHGGKSYDGECPAVHVSRQLDSAMLVGILLARCSRPVHGKNNACGYSFRSYEAYSLAYDLMLAHRIIPSTQATSVNGRSGRMKLILSVAGNDHRDFVDGMYGDVSQAVSAMLDSSTRTALNREPGNKVLLHVDGRDYVRRSVLMAETVRCHYVGVHVDGDDGMVSNDVAVFGTVAVNASPENKDDTSEDDVRSGHPMDAGAGHVVATHATSPVHENGTETCAVPTDAKVLAADGFKLASEVSAGDSLIDRNGHAQRIKAVHMLGFSSVSSVVTDTLGTVQVCDGRSGMVPMGSILVSDGRAVKFSDIHVNDMLAIPHTCDNAQAKEMSTRGGRQNLEHTLAFDLAEYLPGHAKSPISAKEGGSSCHVSDEDALSWVRNRRTAFGRGLCKSDDIATGIGVPASTVRRVGTRLNENNGDASVLRYDDGAIAGMATEWLHANSYGIDFAKWASASVGTIDIRIPRRVEASPALAYILGCYATVGTVAHGALLFSLPGGETSPRARHLMRAFASAFPMAVLNVSGNDRSVRRTLTVTCPPVVGLVAALTTAERDAKRENAYASRIMGEDASYRNASMKVLPEWLTSSSADVRRSLLIGIVDGVLGEDGGEWLWFRSTEYVPMAMVHRVLSSFGVPASLDTKVVRAKGKPSYTSYIVRFPDSNRVRALIGRQERQSGEQAPKAKTMAQAAENGGIGTTIKKLYPISKMLPAVSYLVDGETGDIVTPALVLSGR